MFNRKKSYLIEVSASESQDALTPTFSVTVPFSQAAYALIKEKSTITAKPIGPGALALHVEKPIDDFRNIDITGFAFTFIDQNQLKISITPQTTLFDEQDKLFRSAISMLTRLYYRALTSREAEEIITAYKTYLKQQHPIQSQFSSKNIAHP